MSIIGFMSIAAGILGLGFELYRRISRTEEQRETLGNIPHFVLGMSLVIIVLGIGLVYLAYNPDLLNSERVSEPAQVGQQASEPNKQDKAPPATSSNQAKDDKTTTTSEGISITSYQLCMEFRANEALANTKFKDKVLIVSGTINKIGKDYANKLYLSMDGFDAVSNTACFFDPAKVTELNRLRNGQKVTIKGTCSGMAGDVALQDCLIVSSSPVN